MYLDEATNSVLNYLLFDKAYCCINVYQMSILEHEDTMTLENIRAIDAALIEDVNLRKWLIKNDDLDQERKEKYEAMYNFKLLDLTRN